MEYLQLLFEELRYNYKNLLPRHRLIIKVIGIFLILGILWGIKEELAIQKMNNKYIGSPNPKYDIQNIDKQPIPKDEFFKQQVSMWITACQLPRYAEDSTVCINNILDNSLDCIKRYEDIVPAFISNSSEYDEYKSPFVECILKKRTE